MKYTTPQKRKRTTSGLSSTTAFVSSQQKSVPVLSVAEVKKIARKAVDGTKDLKHKVVSDLVNDINSTQIQALCLTGNIARGDSEFNREADKIKLVRFRAQICLTDSGTYANNGDYNKCYRIVVGRANGTNTGIGSDVWQNNPFTGMGVFYQGGASYNTVDGNIDEKKFKVVYDRTHYMDPNYGYGSTFVLEEPTTTTTGLKFKKIDIDEKLGFIQTYDMDSNNSQLGHMWLFVIPYSPSGSTNMVDITVVTDLQFTSY